MSAPDESGRRKVRLMTVWVGIGIVLMVLGVVTSVWISVLGACLIGSTPVFFTLRAALSDRQTPKTPPPARSHRSGSPPRRRPATLRRRDHG